MLLAAKAYGRGTGDPEGNEIKVYSFSLHFSLNLSPSLEFKYLQDVAYFLCKIKLCLMMDGMLVCAQIHLSTRYSVEGDRKWDERKVKLS